MACCYVPSFPRVLLTLFFPLRFMFSMGRGEGQEGSGECIRDLGSVFQRESKATPFLDTSGGWFASCSQVNHELFVPCPPRSPKESDLPPLGFSYPVREEDPQRVLLLCVQVDERKGATSQSLSAARYPLAGGGWKCKGKWPCCTQGTQGFSPHS